MERTPAADWPGGWLALRVSLNAKKYRKISFFQLAVEFLCITARILCIVGGDSVVGIATSYYIESRWGRDFLLPTRPTTKSCIQWVSEPSRA